MLNKVILIGRVGKDPEFRNLDNNLTVVNFTIATSESFKNKQGEKITNTEWHNLQAWGSLATIIEKYVKKGQLIYIEGKIKTDSWEKDNVKHYKTVISVNELKMLSGAPTEKPTENGGNTSKDDFAPEPTDDLPF